MNNNKNEYNNIFKLNHKVNFCLMNNYYDVFDNSEWNMDEITSSNSNLLINDSVYENEYRSSNKRYSFPQKKGYKFKQTKYR